MMPSSAEIEGFPDHGWYWVVGSNMLGPVILEINVRQLTSHLVLAVLINIYNLLFVYKLV